MSIFDNVRSRFKNNDEEEFERAMREGAFPEGVDDFEPMSNTGMFLPTSYEVDPLADASLPGNIYNAVQASGSFEPQQPNTEAAVVSERIDEVEIETNSSAVHDAAASAYAAPQAESPFDVIDGTYKPVTPHDTYAEVRSEPLFADGSDLTSSHVAHPHVRVLRSDQASNAQLDAELEQRRQARRQAAASRAKAAQASNERFEREHAMRVAQYEEQEEEVPAPQPPHVSAILPMPDVSAVGGDPAALSCAVIRPHTYDDVRSIAQAVLAEQRPTVLVLRGCARDLAGRILDFSFGLCCGIGAELQEFGDEVYAVLPRGTMLTNDDMAALRRQSLVR